MFLKEDTIMKKILAGVLAAASMLSVSATAFAASTDKNVTKAGELTYDVAVTAPKIVLNLVMPAKMSAALNPYGADIKLEPNDSSSTNTTKLGIASAAYKVSNKSTDYGVYIDATAITTITTTDKPNADKTPAWGVVTTAITANSGVKNANMALMGFANVGAMKSTTAPAAANAKATATAQGALVLDSTVAADKTAGVAAGQTSAKQFMYLKAATDADTPTDAYMGFLGVLGSSKTDGSADVEWKEDDAINVNLVLKISAGPKTLT